MVLTLSDTPALSRPTDLTPLAGPPAYAGAPVADRPDEASGLATARLTGQSVEVTGRRSETTTLTANPNGTLTMKQAARPVRVRRDGRWVPVDTTLRRTADGGVAPVAAAVDLTLSGGGDGPLLTIGYEGKSVRLGWTIGSLPQPVLDRNTATYPEVLPGVDLRIEADIEGFSHLLIVKSPAAARNPALRALRLAVAGEGLTLRTGTDGQLSAVDAGGAVVFGGPPSGMWESRPAVAEGSARLPVDDRRATAPRVAPVGVRLDGQGLHLAPDARLLDDPRAEFPIVIDPSLNLTRTSWAMVNSGAPTTSYPNPTGNMSVGTQNSGGSKWRSYWTFDTAALAGAQINYASLDTTEVASGSCTPTSVQLWYHHGASPNPLTWNTQLSAQLADSEYAAKGYSASCPAGSVVFYPFLGLQAVADSGASAVTFYLRAGNESDNLGWKQFGNNPTLSVTYNQRMITSSPAVESMVQGYVNANPRLSVLVVDPDQVWATSVQFEVTKVGTPPVTTTFDAGMVPTGRRATVGPLALSDGTYTWRVRAGYDPEAWLAEVPPLPEQPLWGGWTTGPQFVKDSVAPPLVTATSTSFPEGGWAGSAHTAGSFMFGPNGATDVVAYLYGLDTNPPTIRVAGATPSVSVTPTWDGPHTLYVRAQDQAGNLGPIKAYSFKVGTGGMSTPLPNDITASKLTLSAVGQSAATGVTFQWRRADTDTWVNIPAGHVTTTGGGGISWPVASTGGGAFPVLVWNTEATLAAADAQGIARDGGLQLRATFTGGAWTSAAVPVTFDRDRAAGTSAQVGPGSVNLLTGNMTVSRGDVSLPGLSIGRAFNSRTPGGTDALFGPGWESSAVVGGAAPYTELKVYGSLVQVGLPNGSTLDFTRATTGGTFTSPVGSESLTLTYTAGTDTYTLAHLDGTVVTFTHPSGAAATTYAPTSVVAAGSAGTTTLSWEKVTVDGVEVVRPTRMLAPVPTGVSCTTLVRGCRALTFAYATVTTATPSVPGDYLGRVKEVAYTAWDPNAVPAAMRTVAMARYAYNTSGRLVSAWDPRLDWTDAGGTHHLAETYAYGAGGVLATLTPNAQEPWQFTYTTLPSDASTGRLASASRSALSAGTATETVVYKVPISGTGSAYDLSVGQTARWGQSEPPVDATAVFRANQIPTGNQATGVMPSSYERATLVYMDPDGRVVNMAEPGGSIEATWYDARGNPVRELTAGNRAAALAASTTDTAAEEATLALRESSVSIYSADGRELAETLGPERWFTLATGTLVRGRRHVVYSYDQGAPPTGPFHFVTTEVAGVQYNTGTGVVEADQRTTTTGYDWALKLPTIVTQDPAGLALATRTAYDAAGRMVSTTRPAGGATTNTPATQATVYYRPGTGSGYAECDSRPEWDGLVCRTQPGGQAGSGPELTVKVITYSYQQQLRTIMEKTSAGVLRTTTITYNTAGRPDTTEITGAAGTGQAVPKSRIVYDQQSGQAVRTQSLNGSGGVTAEIIRTYDTLGRLTSYRDADGNVSTTTYDLMSRPATSADGKATRTYSYDTGSERRGLLTQVVDSQGGTFTASYNLDGNLVTENRPNAIVVAIGLHEDGSLRSLTYTKTGCGQPDCTLYTETIDQTAHGQIGANASTLSQQRYGYDAVGRLTSVADTVAGACATRTYAFTTSSNRSGQASYNPATDGACQTTTSASSRTWTFDTADRLNTAGYSYDSLGRTSTMAAADTAIPGGANPSMTYHVNDMARTVTQGTRTATYTLDVTPNRNRSWVDSGAGGVTKVNHYAADVDSPIWTNEGDGTYTRMVSGIAGPAGAVSGVSSTLTWLIANHQGTFVAGVVAGGTGVTYTSEYTENGQPRNSADAGTRRYGWLGTSQRAADNPGGLTLMGARLYTPGSGRFLSTDPVYGGSANPYEYCAGDPANCADTSGAMYCWTFNWSSRYWYYWWGGVGGRRYDFDFGCYFSDREIFIMMIYGWLYVAIGGIIFGLGGIPLGIAYIILGLIIEVLVAHYWWYCGSGSGGAVWVGHLRLWHEWRTGYRWGYPWYRYWYCVR